MDIITRRAVVSRQLKRNVFLFFWCDSKKFKKKFKFFEKMSTNTTWQHPYVDVFRTFNVSSFSSCVKRGDVKTTNDKFLKKMVYRIKGRVPSSNYLRIPNDSSKQTVQMKLTGRYAYFAIRSHPNRDCTMYLDVTTDKGHNLRVTISTRFEKIASRDL